MEEKSFFNENGVSVSNVRFIVHGQTHAMSGVTSVKMFRKDPPRKLLIAIGIFGLLVAVLGDMPKMGGVVVAVSAAAWFLTTPLFSIMLSSASGENSALASKDGAFISKIVAALNDAIVHRG